MLEFIESEVSKALWKAVVSLFWGLMLSVAGLVFLLCLVATGITLVDNEVVSVELATVVMGIGLLVGGSAMVFSPILAVLLFFKKIQRF